MTLQQLQQDLQQLGVELWEEQGRLRYRAPAGVCLLYTSPSPRDS